MDGRGKEGVSGTWLEDGLVRIQRDKRSVMCELMQIEAYQSIKWNS